jgi:hypothetical protein
VMAFSVLTSTGEVLDKITILELKRSKAQEGSEQLTNILTELKLLEGIAASKMRDYHKEVHNLRLVNAALWEVEDQLRKHEREGTFGPQFVELARSVYKYNDERAAIKKAINLHEKSSIIEEKLYS